jgi:cyclopropane fatty-acyl-phospholipid synthase-like methyltransferase
MDTEEEASDYDTMDHSAVNAQFCEDLAQVLDFSDAPRLLDVGTGTAQIPIELCRRHPQCTVVAVDLAAAMLAKARKNVRAADLGERIELRLADAKDPKFTETFDAVVSNSIVHHIAEPKTVFAAMCARVSPGGLIFVRDLARPADAAAVDAIVARYGGAEGTDEASRAIADRQRKLFRDSLHAALTLAEVQALVAPLGIDADAVTMTSDRHWTLSVRRP